MKNRWNIAKRLLIRLHNSQPNRVLRRVIENVHDLRVVRDSYRQWAGPKRRLEKMSDRVPQGAYAKEWAGAKMSAKLIALHTNTCLFFNLHAWKHSHVCYASQSVHGTVVLVFWRMLFRLSVKHKQVNAKLKYFASPANHEQIQRKWTGQTKIQKDLRRSRGRGLVVAKISRTARRANDIGEAESPGLTRRIRAGSPYILSHE